MLPSSVPPGDSLVRRTRRPEFSRDRPHRSCGRTRPPSLRYLGLQRRPQNRNALRHRQCEGRGQESAEAAVSCASAETKWLVSSPGICVGLPLLADTDIANAYSGIVQRILEVGGAAQPFDASHCARSGWRYGTSPRFGHASSNHGWALWNAAGPVVWGPRWGRPMCKVSLRYRMHTSAYSRTPLRVGVRLFDDDRESAYREPMCSLLPSESLKMTEVPQGSFFGGAVNSTPRALSVS